MDFATLHVRLTRDCNAHCSYCSSAGVQEGRMSPDDFRKSIDFIADHVFPRMGIGSDHILTVEYLGGEVLLIPQDELEENVKYARQRIGQMVRHVRDGAQSNLISTPRRAIALHDLFDGNLGTSWDSHTDQRTIKGSAQLYRAMLNNTIESLKTERGHNPGRVLVLDKLTLPHIATEVRRAMDEGYDLVIRPVFLGGSEDVDPASVDDLIAGMNDAFEVWASNTQHRVEPFYSLFNRRTSRGTDDQQKMAGCPFQSDCAFRSLALDPDGSLHICQEMADSQNYKLGNAINADFDEATWRLLARRSTHLSEECSACTWKTECGGGCMNEAIQEFGDPFARTELCPVWKSTFRLIEKTMEKENL